MSEQNTAGKFAMQRVAGFSYDKKELDPGQLYTLNGGGYDETIIRLRYADVITKKDADRYLECGVCLERFASDRYLNEHGAYRHPARFEDADTADKQDAKENKENQRILASMAQNPLDMTMTQAARAA